MEDEEEIKKVAAARFIELLHLASETLQKENNNSPTQNTIMTKTKTKNIKTKTSPPFHSTVEFASAEEMADATTAEIDQALRHSSLSRRQSRFFEPQQPSQFTPRRIQQRSPEYNPNFTEWAGGIKMPSRTPSPSQTINRKIEHLSARESKNKVPDSSNKFAKMAERTYYSNDRDRSSKNGESKSHKEDKKKFTQPRKRSGGDGGDDSPDDSPTSSSDDSSSDSELDSESQSSDESLDGERFRNNQQRRRSTYVRSLSDRRLTRRNNDRMLLVQNQARYDHILLESFSLKKIFTFMDQVYEYQSKYGIELPVATMLSERVCEQILAHHRRLSKEDFYQLRISTVFKLILREISPTSELSFYKLIDRHVEFTTPPKYIPSLSDFKPFYDALLVYRKTFERVLDALSYRNKDNIPPINNKEGGLIKLFLDKITFDYGKLTFRALRDTKFKSFQKFLKAFYKEVENDYSRYLATREGNAHFGGTAYVAAKKSSSSNSTPLYRPRVTPQPSSTKRYNTRLHHTSMDERVEDNKEDRDQPNLHDKSSDTDVNEVNPHAKNENYHSDDDQYQTDKVVEAYDEDDHDVAMDTQSTDEDEFIAQQLQQEMSFIPSNQLKDQKKSEVPNGCFQMLLYGQCSKLASKSKCSYSHDAAALTRTHAYVSKLLANSKFKPGNIARKPPQALGHISLDYYINTADHMHDVMQNLFLNAIPEANILSAVHRSGHLDLHGRNPLMVEKVLFDTGALHANYISKRFVDLHRDQLQPYLQPCNGVVTLADNRTKASIDHVLTIPIVFVDGSGQSHRAVIDFCVFDMNTNDAIIGLPSILMHFHVLFKDMIDSAVIDLDHQTSLSHVDGVYPWTKPVDLEAPEDIDTELPSSFPEPLHYMEMSTEDAVKEYLSLIPTHVDPKFSSATPVIKLLETKGVKVFVPQNWNGVNGVAPLKLNFREGMPQSMKPRARPINPKLYEHAHKEFNRLLKYFYVPCNSPIASCLVIAPKATAPFIRFCGDYVLVNKWIITGHYPIPDVGKHLAKISSYSVFVDLDWTNSFHQFALDTETSEKLSIQTPWGQVRPLFLPEGVPPASGFLQQMVDDIFGDFSDWCIAIFDNLLVLATDYDDAYRKLDIILDRCIERNVYLKFSKSWLGYDHAKFFGYVCKHGKYELAQDRKDALKSIAFPSSIKQMQSFLGAALFFKNFLPHYSTLVAPLHDMTKQSFNWDPTTWTLDYRLIFEQVKDALQDATSIFYPNYNLVWLLRTDASQLGVGAVLLQLFEPPDSSGEIQYQPLGFASQKFSAQATNWSTIEQEAYGIYFGVKSFAYYLRCKPFILETDHNNLLWMEASAVPKVIRWRVYLQSFSFTLRHIPGKQNLVADWLSRAASIDPTSPTALTSILGFLYFISGSLHVVRATSDELDDTHIPNDLLPKPNDENNSPSHIRDVAANIQHQVLPLPPNHISPEEVLRLVHGKRMGHFGIRKTWKLLNEHFPGHRIPYKVVEEFVMTCPICQKDRLGMADTLEPIVLTLKPEQRRSMVGVDTLTITPPDDAGNCYVTVIVNHFTKLVGLYPSKSHDAISTATALFQYFCTYGLVDSIISDPGSEFMNDVINQLMQWFGIRHRFSLVDRHESNGVEHTNGLILRHLKALIFDERIQHRWSHPTVLPLIQFMLNTFDNSETGVVPFHAHFGTADATYFQLPALKEGEEEDSLLLTQQYLINLDKNLKTLYEISKKHQDRIALERKKHSSPELQNTFQPGDRVLWQRDPNIPLPSKLSPKFVGPYEVISQDRNDVTCRHLILGHIKVFHVSRLKIFHGSLESAKTTAMIDNNQYVISEFKAYRGDPKTRTQMEFEVLFEDGSLVWLPWSKDLFNTVQYEAYCRSRPELYPLIYDAKIAGKRVKELNASPITEVKPGDSVLVDIRSYGAGWYDSLSLEDKHHSNYLVEYRYVKWKSNRHLKIEAICPLFAETFVVDHAFVKFYGSWSEDDWVSSGLNMKVIDDDLIALVPELLPNNNKSKHK